MEKTRVNLGLLILRVTLGILMLFHGFSKMMNGLEGIKGMLESYGLLSVIAYGVLIGEVIVPILLVIGFRTRIAALVYAINMLIAVMLVHINDIFTLSTTGGWTLELQGLYFFGALALFFTGAGKFAVSVSNRWD
ncbi:DoxX family protein [Leeuwenhoekiella sp. A16]|uniref:DoxX family protein n=1 Tax=unclassified Leeuwenhoekiella TaxID=2615029 RepID=UPI003A808BEC